MREPTREQVERVVDAIEAAYALNEISVRVFDAAALLRALLDRAETAERESGQACRSVDADD
jgi:hypothetical protein